MAEQELLEVATFLVEQLDLNSPLSLDPLDPSLLVQALTALFPSSATLWTQVGNFDPEEQWNAVLEFIQINLLGGNFIEIQSLGMEEIFQIYNLVAAYAKKFKAQDQPLHSKAKAEGSSIKEQRKKSRQKSRGSAPKDQAKRSQPEKKQNGRKPNPVKQQKKEASRVEKKRADQQEKNNGMGQLEPGSYPKELSGSKGRKKSRKRGRQESGLGQEKTKEHKKAVEIDLQAQLIKGVQQAVSKPLHKVNPKTDTRFRDQKATEAVRKADRQFAYFLKDYQRQRQLKRHLHPLIRDKVCKKNADQQFLKGMELKQKALQEEVTNQQLKYLLALRDRKLAFVNKIHRLTEQLEKERQVDWAHQQRQLINEQRAKTAKEIARTEGVFDTNMQLLREQYQEGRNRGASETREELQVCREMGHVLEQRKRNQLQTMKVLWEQENSKLSSIVGEEQKVRAKLIDLYRRNRP